MSWSDWGAFVGEDGSDVGSGPSLAVSLLEAKKDQDLIKSQIEEDFFS